MKRALFAVVGPSESVEKDQELVMKTEECAFKSPQKRKLKQHHVSK